MGKVRGKWKGTERENKRDAEKKDIIPSIEFRAKQYRSFPFYVIIITVQSFFPGNHFSSAYQPFV